jgi:hypothetical protein
LQSHIKPEHQEVKLELALDLHSSNYDTSRGEQIACNVDGGPASKNEKKAEEKFFKKLVVLLSCMGISASVLLQWEAVYVTCCALFYFLCVYYDTFQHIQTRQSHWI